MSKEKRSSQDEAVQKELEGVPAEMLDGSADEESGEDAADDALASLRRDLDAARQDVLYARAETQNVRRRAERDVADARSYAATDFARDILGVSDNLQRAIASVPADLREDERVKNFLAGIDATLRELEKVLGQHGITRIAAMGLPLDPNQHQAMIEVPSSEAEPGTVVQEMQPGYMIKDRLLRPALVGVAKQPE
ncbi:nucleotide exchange factor GrpE [Porphyrobacter sp. GA68]|uniref:nucleotide exchange factor GrpE n=1 Tax=Porphyrobacter sp. GA68 TaxID=2883480 RepID=UPI001D192F19|nr:nucleotide exchange factor GrpE [Porphyrobacter sp. GA68]